MMKPSPSLLALAVIPVILAIPQSSQAQERTYAGSDNCGLCHADQAEWLVGSVHARAVLRTSSGEEVTRLRILPRPGIGASGVNDR